MSDLLYTIAFTIGFNLPFCVSFAQTVAPLLHTPYGYVPPVGL